MCTSIEWRSDSFYFGRNMDIDYDFGQRVVITPRNFPFAFRSAGELKTHFAFMGMAAVYENYPLYAEAVNEKGLCMAGLNFPLNAFYPDNIRIGKENIAPFELIPYFLGKYKSVKEVREGLSDIHIVNIPFSKEIPNTPLHFHIADRNEGIVLESTNDGLTVYENPVGIMTNNPTFDFHLQNLLHYTNLSPLTPSGEGDTVHPFGKGLGAFGLPGDASSASRFVKCAFLLKYAEKGRTQEENVSRFFRILENLSVVKGTIKTEKGEDHYTTYNCCMNADKGIYYYKAYDAYKVREVSFRQFNLESEKLIIKEK